MHRSSLATLALLTLLLPAAAGGPARAQEAAAGPRVVVLGFDGADARLVERWMESGDLPNLSLGADGKGSLTVPLAGPRAEVEPILFDTDGTAIVIHAAADDHRTDPSGSSGARIACGVLTRG